MKNGTEHQAFNLFYENLDRNSRGGWQSNALGTGQHRYCNDGIQVYRNFIQEREGMRDLLINLVGQCESMFGTGMHGQAYDHKQMAQAMQGDVEYYPLADFLGHVVASVKGDAKHANVGLKVERRYMAAVIPEKRKESIRKSGCEFLVFLNQDYIGGDIWFPTRREVIAPQAGTLVRFLSGIPYGLNMVHGGYAFTLFGTIQATARDVRR